MGYSISYNAAGLHLIPILIFLNPSSNDRFLHCVLNTAFAKSCGVKVRFSNLSPTLDCLFENTVTILYSNFYSAESPCEPEALRAGK